MGKNKSKRKNISFTITTSRTLLIKTKLFYQRHMDNVVLSLDGRKYVHDT